MNFERLFGMFPEEDYLLGKYPKELAAQSLDYVLKEKNGRGAFCA
jgi:hypothetical protein